MSNPFTSLADILPESTKGNEPYKIGKVISIDSLRVDIGNMVLENSDLIFLREIRQLLTVDCRLLMIPTKDEQMFCVLGVLE